MKTTLLFTSLTALLITGIATAQTTFDFTAGTLSGSGAGQTWSQTVDGITLTVIFNEDTDDAVDYAAAGSPVLANANGLYMGALYQQTVNDFIATYRRFGVTFTFSQDVRLTDYQTGNLINDTSKVYNVFTLEGGNVSAVGRGLRSGGESAPFELQALVPANTPIHSYCAIKNLRLASITVNPEPYVAPNIPPLPAGNETGNRKAVIHAASGSTPSIYFCLKDEALYAWFDRRDGITHPEFPILPGAGSGVLDFWSTYLGGNLLLIETVEGPLVYDLHAGDEQIRNFPITNPDFPIDADQYALGHDTRSEGGVDGLPYALALREGQVHLSDLSVPGLLPLPPEIAAGGISQIVGTTDTIALAVKDGNVIAWGDATSLATALLNVPTAVASGGQVVKVDYSHGLAVALLTDGTLVEWGFNAAIAPTTPALQGDIVDFQLSGEVLLALKTDGSLAINETLVDGFDLGPYTSLVDTDKDGDFNTLGLVEAIPTIVQQIGFEWDQLHLSESDPVACTVLLPGGRMVNWGAVDAPGRNKINQMSLQTLPWYVNRVIYPQTASRLSDSGGAPDAGELSMLGAGGLGIQWGSNTQYEVQTTTDMLGGQWEPLPTDANNRFYRIQETNE